MMSIINYIDDHLGPFHLQGATLFCMIRSSYTVLCINIINIIIIFLLMMMLCVSVITYNNHHHLCSHDIVMIRDKSNLPTKRKSTVRAAKRWRGQVGHAPRHHHYEEDDEDRV